jgi:hypothetical protein
MVQPWFFDVSGTQDQGIGKISNILPSPSRDEDGNYK